MHPKTTEKGQALVLIALAAVGLFAFAALAIDGSRVFSDRRHSQNASDTAAYAAALARVRGSSTWADIGKTRASSNGYINNGVTVVEVYTCKEWKDLSGEECKGLPATLTDTIRNEYIIVRIKSVVDLTLARVIGWKQITNYTDAVVRASPAKIDEWFDGKAIVSTKKDCPKPGDNYVPLVLGGNGATVINNSGFFVNSSCDPAIKDNGSSNEIKTSTGVCVFGGVPDNINNDGDFQKIDGSPLNPAEHCGTQVEITDYWMPDKDPSLLAPYCAPKGNITGSGGDYVATPGYYNTGPFPDKTPAGTLKLQKGVYCIYDGIDINSHWIITTDFDGDGPDADEGVFFYIIGGDVKFNGGPSITLHPMTSTSGGFDAKLLNYLIFIPASHEATITLNGNSGSIFSGEILAPSSHITLDGGASGDSFTLNTQIIGYDTTITGNGTLNITYDPSKLPPAMIMPTISGIE